MSWLIFSIVSGAGLFVALGIDIFALGANEMHEYVCTRWAFKAATTVVAVAVAILLTREH